jgi:hypothetical protein
VPNPSTSSGHRFWLSASQVRERLLTQEHIARVEGISLKSICQVAQDTGFAEVRRLLRQIFKFTADGPQWRDKVLLDRLFELNEALMARLEAGEGLTPQLMLEAEALKEAVGAPITPLKKRLPLAYRLQRAIFGQWEEIDDGQVLCPHCGSSLVAGKENTPRNKKYRHPETGEWCQVEGYRYYSLNPICSLGPLPTTRRAVVLGVDGGHGVVGSDGLHAPAHHLPAGG